MARRPAIYFLLFWVTFWPARSLAGAGRARGLAQRGASPAQFLLAWLVPAWIVFELVVTKLPHYVLPLYPAIAILIARRDRTARAVASAWLVRGTVWWFLIPASRWRRSAIVAA